MRLGIIGHGAVADILLAGLAAGEARLARLVCLARPEARSRAEVLLARHIGLAPAAVVETCLSDFIGGGLDLVVECAGQGALRDVGEAVLAAGIDLVPASVGAFADEALHRTLRAAAAASGARLLLPSGAVGGLDLLGAARLAGIEQVTYVSRKPPAAWRGTPAEELIDLANVAAATAFYEGSARAAARDYPKNANVAAAIALAGIGFERTQVRLIADPAARDNTHEITLRSACADMELRIAGRAAATNPKTSQTTGYSLAHMVLGRMIPEAV